MKKVLMYATAFAMTFAFASCGGNGEAADENATDSTEVVTDNAQADDATDAVDATDNAADESMDVAPADSAPAADAEGDAPAE